MTEREAELEARRLERERSVLTADDAEQIAEGIENFIMDGDPEVDAIWQPYVDKMRAIAVALRCC